MTIYIKTKNPDHNNNPTIEILTIRRIFMLRYCLKNRSYYVHTFIKRGMTITETITRGYNFSCALEYLSKKWNIRLSIKNLIEFQQAIYKTKKGG